MKSIKWVIVMLLMTQSFVVRAEKQLSAAEREQIKEAITLCDQGQAERSVEILSKLAEKYPKDYVINYELCVSKHVMQQYNEVITLTKKLEKHPAADEHLYQLQGNTYDYMGKRKEAIASYDKGLKRFPKAGCLYMEKGTILLGEHQYYNAILMYEKAIEKEPSFSSPYVRVSSIFLNTPEPVWGLIYGEAYLLMSQDVRNPQLQKYMVNTLNNAFVLENDSTIHVSLTQQKIQMKGLRIVNIPFEIAYELVAKETALTLQKEHRDTLTVKDLIQIRKDVVKVYEEDWKEENPNYLFDYQAKLIAGGYFEAFTYELFKDAFPKEYEEYTAVSENQKILEALHLWQSYNPFQPNESQFIKRIE